MGRYQPQHGLCAAAQSGVGAVPVDAARHPALQPPGAHQPGGGPKRAPQPRRAAGGRPLWRAVLRALSAADGGRNLVDAEPRDPGISSRNVPSILSKPRLAAGLQPAALAYRQRRRAQLCAGDCQPAGRCACRHAGARHPPGRDPCRCAHGFGKRAIRRRGARHTRSADAASARRCHRRRARRAGRFPVPAQHRIPAPGYPLVAAPTARVVGVELSGCAAHRHHGGRAVRQLSAEPAATVAGVDARGGHAQSIRAACGRWPIALSIRCLPCA